MTANNSDGNIISPSPGILISIDKGIDRKNRLFKVSKLVVRITKTIKQAITINGAHSLKILLRIAVANTAKSIQNAFFERGVTKSIKSVCFLNSGNKCNNNMAAIKSDPSFLC